MTKARRITLLFLIASALGVAWGVAYFPLRQAAANTQLVSCVNHASFLKIELLRYWEMYDSFPSNQRTPPEELICSLDFRNGDRPSTLAFVNCNAAAPGQRIGGWQTVNASRKSWNEILETIDKPEIPIVWCGKAHDISLFSGERERMRCVIMYDLDIVTRSDEALQSRLDVINSVLKKNGEDPISIDVEGRADYWSIARPFQTSGESDDDGSAEHDTTK